MKSQQELNRFEIRFSGLGGQGIITLGKVMGQGLALGHGYNVTQTQSYGPEARGGSSRCDLVVSSQPISYPKAESLDLLVALSQEACNAYYPYLKPGGALVLESDLVKQPPTNKFLGLPFSALARDKVGVAQAMNTVVLGALAYLLPFVNQSVMRKSLESTLPAKIRAVNVKAFNLGHRLAGKHWGENAGQVWRVEDTEHE
ncbi:MAG: 2-oxoacid:acceptor oxidoreductase family protein [Pseudodesulfovibrio sp.]|uniref:Pyruvate/ketoisovalerate oxidoreductase, catalytic domain protein n=1 Tax=Pseudodesulfovibrio aespoeensis (strain ATCC 700646 / DSM 10631 / Aspo-2) TaxID=643562 RepID=E6VS49_PSEA9|nr:MULTISPECIES: 2-oxoacid:acceptor oxidoreductase family protein [Pseudodesulfovibrio]MBU4191030.1 2-oxoacid:acceptor oxidoreductase family protein [Pseudomonadota bacterium]ADU63094.1 Pyruvate/ketoisovalerate oxidoreductase, catalytic domain protein [Pseudodesulfovibrio aespoeensis Aspo-2]MBU4243199.1 2-oxoacid:acceptor oxidoreductase family protein [Pseudomonadota bacterium]MBU4379627.1 2-oxoacid:acceptor oxidoreductase family protein [Pseudomonadota bacterium]MBU4474130.1 2-oxoacid:accepto